MSAQIERRETSAVRRTPEGFIDYDHYRAVARRERRNAVAATWSGFAARMRRSVGQRSAPASGSTWGETKRDTDAKRSADFGHEPNVLLISTH